MLRRLQLDHSVDCLRDGQEDVSFFIQLNGYSARPNAELPEPREWLQTQWAELYPRLPPLESYLRAGRVLLLLDALNEMPHKSSDEYFAIVRRWQAFAQEAARWGNRLVFSCRSLDYSAPLSGPGLRVPQVEVQPLNEGQIQDFLKAYIPAHGRRFPYGEAFEVSRSNTFESHIRRTTPVGVFDNATPEGAFDLSGNAYTWTLSIYDQEQFSYPYQSADGRREDIHQTDVRRFLRGGSWNDDQDLARAVCRYFNSPSARGNGFGFRVVGSRPPSS